MFCAVEIQTATGRIYGISDSRFEI